MPAAETCDTNLTPAVVPSTSVTIPLKYPSRTVVDPTPGRTNPCGTA